MDVCRLRCAVKEGVSAIVCLLDTCISGCGAVESNHLGVNAIDNASLLSMSDKRSSPRGTYQRTAR